MLTDILCGFCSLSRISKAHTEFIASCCNRINGCCRRCKQECALCRLCSYCNTGTGSSCSAKHLHSFIKKVIISIYRLLRITHIVAGIKYLNLISVKSSVFIDFVYRNFSCIIYVCTILCIIACHWADHTDFKCFVSFCEYCCGHGSCCCHSCCRSYT